MRFNFEKTKSVQSAIAKAMGSTLQAADAVANLVAEIGLPGRLSDLKVNPEDLEAVATGAMENLWVKTNPEPISDVEQIRHLLAKAR